MYVRVSCTLLRKDANYLAYFRSFCNTGLALVKTTNPTDQNIRYIDLSDQRELQLPLVSLFFAMERCKTCFFCSPVITPLFYLYEAKCKESRRSKQPHLTIFIFLQQRTSMSETFCFFPWNLPFYVGTS